MKREEILLKYKDQLLKGISKQTIYSLNEVEEVFNRVKSFDKTICVLDAATRLNLNPSGLMLLKDGYLK